MQNVNKNVTKSEKDLLKAAKAASKKGADITTLLGKDKDEKELRDKLVNKLKQKEINKMEQCGEKLRKSGAFLYSDAEDISDEDLDVIVFFYFNWLSFIGLKVDQGWQFPGFVEKPENSCFSPVSLVCSKL